MKKIVRLTESELNGIIKKVLKEQDYSFSEPEDVKKQTTDPYDKNDAKDAYLQHNRDMQAAQAAQKTQKSPQSLKYKSQQDLKTYPKLGDMGETVSQLQQRLQELGYDIGKAGADGYFGPKTAEAVKLYKQKKNIPPINSEIDSTTWVGIVRDSNYLTQQGQKSTVTPTVIQKKLIEAGYNIKPDGVIGPITRKAIRDFQSKQGISPASGYLDKGTISKLLSYVKGNETNPTEYGQYSNYGNVNPNNRPAEGKKENEPNSTEYGQYSNYGNVNPNNQTASTENKPKPKSGQKLGDMLKKGY
jgi:peptidoglycan hydrolase-like protein with peptidoglycan-binding domain